MEGKQSGPQMTLIPDCGRRQSIAPQKGEKEHYLGCSEVAGGRRGIAEGGLPARPGHRNWGYAKSLERYSVYSY